MSTSAADADSLRAAVLLHAQTLGFDVARITHADAIPHAGQDLAAHLAAGFHGTMDWLAREPERRASPRGLWPDVRSIIMVGVNYADGRDPMAALHQPDEAALSLYARRKDYHDIVKQRLKKLARFLVDKGNSDVKVFVDTAPVLEKPLAAAAGIGWQGKHTVLVSRDFGNWLFLGAIYTTALLTPDAPESDHCGRCTRCLTACPTDAFVAPHQLDSRRCLAYLTIEHKGPIPRNLREKMGNRVFGCDDCLAVCPWNKFAQDCRDAKLAALPQLYGLKLADLAALDDGAFRTLFAGTPIKRTGRARFLRNVLIAIGNSGRSILVPAAERCLGDAEPLVRGAAIWALSRLLPKPEFVALARQRGIDPDAEVAAEWAAAHEEVVLK